MSVCGGPDFIQKFMAFAILNINGSRGSVHVPFAHVELDEACSARGIQKFSTLILVMHTHKRRNPYYLKNEWMNEWMKEWKNEWTNERINGGWMDGRTNGRTNKWMSQEGRKEGRMPWLQIIYIYAYIRYLVMRAWYFENQEIPYRE